MADRVYAYDVTVPAGTLEAAPQITALPIALGIVTDIEVLVPPGPSGLVGWRVQHSQETVIPYNSAEWIVTDGEVIKWPLRHFPVGNAWRMAAYNLDIYPHTMYVRMLVDNTQRATSSAIALLPIVPDLPQVVTE